MGEYSQLYVAFDTSKTKHAVAIVDGGRCGGVRFLGDVASSPARVERLTRKLAECYDKLHFCYEAGPTGYGLYRHIRELSHDCTVVAAVADSEEAGRADQDQSARWGDLGPAVACRQANCGVGAGCHSRGGT